MIKNGAAHNPAADDHNFCMRLHERPFVFRQCGGAPRQLSNEEWNRRVALELSERIIGSLLQQIKKEKSMAGNFATVRYMVNDVGVSVTFYTTHLGFELQHHAGDAFASVTRFHCGCC